MKKNMCLYISAIIITILAFNIISPKIDASVWISPMNMLAEGDITEDGVCEVQKVIKFKNDANKSAIVNITTSNITVIFENKTFELLPYEEKTIYPIVIVEQGNRKGKILIKSFETEDSNHTTGSKVVTTMVITVTSIGRLENSSSIEYKLDALFYYIFILIIIVILITVFIMRKKKK